VKFTQEGNIELIVQSKGKQSNKSIQLLFQIKDTGIGIGPDRLPVIFDSFVQADSSTTREYGGSGLGTTISKRLVEMMGGEIGVESQLGEGSIFWFTLSLKEGEGLEIRPKRLSLESIGINFKGKKVLLAEDYDTNRQIATIHLEGIGFQVDAANNGVEALERFRNKNYDLIIMDLQMPGMDGIEATKLIRLTEKGKDLVILGLTANAYDEVKEICLEAGMNEVLTKPITRNSLINQVAKSLGYKVNEEDKGSNKNKKVLIDYSGFLEDFEHNRDLANQIIRDFIATMELNLDLLNTAIGKNHLEIIQRQAHTIKGGAINITANDMAEAAYSIEKAAKEKEKINFSQYYQKLYDEYIRLKEYVETTLF
jgi:CheY-like chemotaxis protein